MCDHGEIVMSALSKRDMGIFSIENMKDIVLHVFDLQKDRYLFDVDFIKVVA